MLDEDVVFEEGEEIKFIEVKINNDDNWEPDQDFYVQMYRNGEKLKGKDNLTKITIIDDDEPGMIYFKSNMVSALATEKFAEIEIFRKNGSDGNVSVQWKTV